MVSKAYKVVKKTVKVRKASKEIEADILKFLKAHPGMDILTLSKKIGYNRLTVSKYLYGLVLTKKISVRRVGNAKLHYLKED